MKLIKFTILFALIAAAIVGFSYYRGIYVPLDSDGENQVFRVASGEGVEQIAGRLKRAGLIRSDRYFTIYVSLNGLDKKLQAGEYELSPAVPAGQIAAALTTGRQLSREQTIRILEGWNIKQIDDYLAGEGLIQHGELVALANRPLGEWQDSFSPGEFIGQAPARAGLEGFLFPDTYRIYKDADAETIIDTMIRNFNEKIDEQMRRDIKAQDRELFDIITMASLVEKEVRDYEDMRIVAGIFWDRIKIGQPLESCATLAYILGVNKPQYSRADTEIDSPYNTYRNYGLPPGPIASPGLSAIRAAVYPEYTDYNYFLSRLDTGETVFSATYEEHLRNKAKFLD